MCGGSPPTPKAPPKPVPQREATIDGTRERQRSAAEGSNGGYESTMLTGANGLSGQATTATPTLGT